MIAEHPATRTISMGVTETEVMCGYCKEWYFQLADNHYTIRMCPHCGKSLPVDAERAEAFLKLYGGEDEKEDDA